MAKNLCKLPFHFDRKAKQQKFRSFVEENLKLSRPLATLEDLQQEAQGLDKQGAPGKGIRTMKTIMLVFGTRPEAIKMCPLVTELKSRDGFKTVVCVTGQHRQMLDMVLKTFHVTPDWDLSVMLEKQTLFDVTANVLNGIKGVLEEVKPDVVLVHGDTSTTFATALACFYLQIPVGHVEAGLRTHDLYSPFPEEFNRQAVGILSKYHFAPTAMAKENLLREGKPEDSIYVTGNTAIDALKTTVREHYSHPELEWAAGSRLILLTGPPPGKSGAAYAQYVPGNPTGFGRASRCKGNLPHSHEPSGPPHCGGRIGRQ